MRPWIVLVPMAVLCTITYGQWRLRAQASARVIAPLTGLEFITLIGDGKWVPIASEDTAGMVRAFNDDRRELARMTTPVFAPHGSGDKLSLAPSARLRHDGIVDEWSALSRTHEAVVEKYIALSTATSP